MRVTLAILADAANLSKEGKLNILGGFDSIVVGSVPTIHPHMSLVLCVEAEEKEAGTRQPFEIRCVGPQGDTVLAAKGTITPPSDFGGGAQVIRGTEIVEVRGLKFSDFGDYEVRMLIDDRVECRVPLTISPTQAG